MKTPGMEQTTALAQPTTPAERQDVAVALRAQWGAGRAPWAWISLKLEFGRSRGAPDDPAELPDPQDEPPTEDG
jgi:hypothetical protein